MRKTQMLTLGIAAALFAAGCTKQPATDQPSTAAQTPEAAAGGDACPTAKGGGPAEAVAEFLEAVRTGNDEAAARMLSEAARRKTAALNRAVTPPASDNAKFTVGKVDYVSHDGARVASTWTDIDPDGQPKTDEAIWVLRHESDGWRIAGVAWQVFPGEPPLLLNFEDPQDMIRKQQWVREEIQRRAEKEESGFQSQTVKKPEKSIRR